MLWDIERMEPVYIKILLGKKYVGINMELASVQSSTRRSSKKHLLIRIRVNYFLNKPYIKQAIRFIQPSALLYGPRPSVPSLRPSYSANVHSISASLKQVA